MRKKGRRKENKHVLSSLSLSHLCFLSLLLFFFNLPLPYLPCPLFIPFLSLSSSVFPFVPLLILHFLRLLQLSPLHLFFPSLFSCFLSHNLHPFISLPPSLPPVSLPPSPLSPSSLILFSKASQTPASSRSVYLFVHQ